MMQNKFLCDTAEEYNQAHKKLLYGNYDCVILDIGLPGGSGLDLLRSIKRNKKKDGVLIISAKNSVDDKIKGLEIGADDYLTKPFHLAELSARVNSIIRRRTFNGNDIIIIEGLTINVADKMVTAGNKTPDLTRKEYELLLYFVSNKNRVITKESILDHLWGYNSNSPDSYDIIYSHIKNLRKKLSECGCPDYIKAVYGMGYKFVAG